MEWRDIFPKDFFILILRHTFETAIMIIAVSLTGKLLDFLISDKTALYIFHLIEYIWIGIALLALLANFTKEIYHLFSGAKNEQQQHIFNFA